MEERKVGSMVYRSKVVLVSLSLILGVGIIAMPSARADSLDVLGGVVSWSDKMYLPDGCSSFSFQYKNNTGVELLQLGFVLTDPYGRAVENASEVGIAPGKSGTWNQQMCYFDFKNSIGPYVMKVFVKDYNSTQREAEKEIFFLAIPGSSASSSSGLNPTPTPTPAPTVYITNPADLELASVLAKLNAQVNTLKGKLKKICSFKPKPKGC
jgi:hypothetical protein